MRTSTAALLCSAALAAATSLTPTPARAALTATLLSCQEATTVTGVFVYVGTYTTGNHTFTRTFKQWCPAVLQVE